MFYSVSKDEIIHKQVEGIQKLFKTLDLLGKDAYKILTLTISGYDNVPEELYEIPKVRSWVQRMAKKYPHFLYFIDIDNAPHIHLLGCLGDVESVYLGEVLTIREMMMRGLTHEDMPPKVHKFHFSDEYAKLLRNGITRYCDEIGDAIGKLELLKRLRLMTK